MHLVADNAEKVDFAGEFSIEYKQIQDPKHGLRDHVHFVINDLSGTFTRELSQHKDFESCDWENTLKHPLKQSMAPGAKVEVQFLKDEDSLIPSSRMLQQT